MSLVHVNGYYLKYKIGSTPTVRELATLLCLRSTSTVQGYIDRLVNNGYLEREKDYPRTLRVSNRKI